MQLNVVRPWQLLFLRLDGVAGQGRQRVHSRVLHAGQHLSHLVVILGLAAVEWGHFGTTCMGGTTLAVDVADSMRCCVPHRRVFDVRYTYWLENVTKSWWVPV